MVIVQVICSFYFVPDISYAIVTDPFGSGCHLGPTSRHNFNKALYFLYRFVRENGSDSLFFLDGTNSNLSRCVKYEGKSLKKRFTSEIWFYKLIHFFPFFIFFKRRKLVFSIQTGTEETKKEFKMITSKWDLYPFLFLLQPLSE